MSRWWSRLLLWPALLLLLVALLLPFTATGTRVLLQAADRFSPLEIQYGGGSLAAQLEITRLAFADEGIQLELQDVLAELELACLWRSVVCLHQLRARQFDLTLLPGPGKEGEPEQEGGADNEQSLLTFPVRIEIASLALQGTRVRWGSGQWQQGRLESSVVIDGSTVHVGPAVLVDGQLALQSRTSDAPSVEGAIILPEVQLPLELLVDELHLEQPAWDIYGAQGGLDSLLLQGSWRGAALQLQQLQARSRALGELALQGELAFFGQWPLSLAAQLTLEEFDGWPDLLQRAVTVTAVGDLAALELTADVSGPVALSARGELDTLQPELPFSLSLDAAWSEVLPLAELVDLPESLSDLAMASPLQASVGGSLAEQVFQLQGNVSGTGYPSVDLHLAGSHRQGVVAVEDVRLRDTGADNTLWAQGEIGYGERLHGSLQLESSGFDLPRQGHFASGRLHGQLQLEGSSAGPEWQVSLSGVNIAGTVNGLPALVTGYAGFDSDMQLAPSDLRAQLNEAHLLLKVAGDGADRARLELAVEDIGRWLPDSRGQLSLQLTPRADWEQLALSGSLADIEWSGLQVDGGEISGVYRPGENHAFNLELSLSELLMAGVDLASLRLKAVGDESSGALWIGSQGELEGELSLNAARVNDTDWAGQLRPTTLKTTWGAWRLEQPVAIGWSRSSAQLQVAGHCWQYSQTQICPGDLLLAEQGEASLDVNGGMDFLASLFPNAVAVQGELQSRLAASWAPAVPLVLEGTLQARQVRVTRDFGEGESAAVHWDLADASIRQTDQGLQLTAAVHREGRRVIDLDGLLPASRDAPLAATLDFSGLQLSNLAPLVANLEALEGALTGSLRVHGTVNQPLAQGTLKLAEGRFIALGNPTELRDLQLDIEAQGDRARLSGSGLLGGGALQLGGELLTGPEWRLELAIKGGNHEVLLPPATQMIVSEELQLSATAGLLDLVGELTVHEGVLRHQQLPAGSVSLSADVVKVDFNGNVLQESRPFDTSVDVRLLVEDNFKVVGDTLNTTVGGDLHLVQIAGRPLQLFGNMNVIGGELRALQQRLRVTRGTISFTGSPENPSLDVRARREISRAKVIAGVHVRGSLEQPTLEVFSDPAMSQGEAMSYLLRGRGLDAGASEDGVAMALSMGAGAVNQSLLVSELNRIPGINNVAFGSQGAEDDTAATLGGYIGERLYLSYGMGIYEPVNVLTARLYLQTRLWLEVVSRLENSVDLYYSFDIK